MKKNTMVIFITFMMILIFPGIIFAGATYEKAQHRLPPVIYSLDIPQTVESGKTYDFNWTVMGYHQTYNIVINIYDKYNTKIATDNVSPYKETEGQYQWDDVDSRQFHYSTSLRPKFSGYQELIVRFFASPMNDPIDNTYLSCLVPGGLGYQAGDTTGRKIKIYGIPSDSISLDLGIGGYFAGAVSNSYLKTTDSYRGFDSARIKIFSIGERSRITLTFMPYHEKDDEGYAYKVVLPWQLKIKSFDLSNTKQPGEDTNYETLSLIGDEIVGKILGKLTFPIKLFLSNIPTAGDPPYASYIRDNHIISKSVFPYQKLQGVFERDNDNVAIQFVIDMDMTIGEVYQALKQYGMSLYVGGHPGNELFVEGLTVQ